jgi:hypothetical protein
MTMGTKTDVIPESVKAVHLELQKEGIEDIAPELERARRRYYAEHDPRALELSRGIFPEITEQQSYFEFYERECRGT